MTYSKERLGGVAGVLALLSFRVLYSSKLPRDYFFPDFNFGTETDSPKCLRYLRRISAFYPYALELPLKYTIPASYATKHKPRF
jgi:hypothetical protein